MSLASDNPNYMIPDYFRNPVLRPYLSNVRDWQGYIRFLGLPDRRDHPDVIIDRLFVEPLLTHRYVSPDEDPGSWLNQAETLLDALSAATPLMLLGDPGIGKSTLLNNVAWLLSRPAENALIDRLGWRLPLPMVLRELPIRGVKDFDGLLNAFLSREMSAPLREDDGRYLREALAEGQAFLLLDGIDEIGDRKTREGLRNAVFDGISRYPACRWLLSSRIVGYAEVPFDTPRSRPEEGPYREERPPGLDERSLRSMSRESRRMRGISPGGRVATRYIAPFDDRRIAAFARNWYVQREAAATRAGANASHLVQAVHADESILRLARVPNLLTMMALIHRIEATLPHGRALLYERIAEAYLESIDRFRGIDLGPHDLARKKGWLARIGFEMQRRRTKGHADGRDILVDVDTVRGWLSEEMGRGPARPGSPTAGEFLEIVGRRSGLFLPRGEGRYAFVHLSFQEYFAAVALEREVTRLRWAREEDSRLGFNRGDLKEWAGRSVWRETFSFVLELLAAQEHDDWHADLLECVFGREFSRLSDPACDGEEALNVGHLLARLAANSRSGLSPEDRDSAVTACVATQLRAQSSLQNKMHRRLMSQSIFEGLLGSDVLSSSGVFEKIGTQMKEAGISELDLEGVQISELPNLENFPALTGLRLSQTHVFDLSPLANLITLEWLDLIYAPIKNLGPLTDLTALKHLHIVNEEISDLCPLANLTALEVLQLGGTKISDLTPLENLTALRNLYLLDTKVSDLSPLGNLTALESLYLDTEVSHITPLKNLTALKVLSLFGAKVLDLTPLEKLTTLEVVEFIGIRISSLESLEQLTALRSFSFFDMPVSDLAPLSKLATLESLYMESVEVSDLTPLENLPSLKRLFLWDTPVSDLAPLKCLVALEYLDLMDTKVPRGAIEDLRKSLPNLRVSFSNEDESAQL